AARSHVPDGAAPGAHQVLVRPVRVGGVAPGAAVGGDLDDLAEGDEFAQGVVDGGPGDLGQASGGAGVHLVGGEVHVVAVEYLRDGPALWGQAPAAAPQSCQQVAHVCSPVRRRWDGRKTNNGDVRFSIMY